MFMSKHARSATIGLAAIGALFGGAGAAQAAPTGPAIPLNTGQEAPAPSVGGAHGKFSYGIGGSELCYTIEVTHLSTPAVAAHIHLGDRNVA